MGGTEEKENHGEEIEKKDKKKKEKEGKEKNPEDKKDPIKLKQKLEKLDAKIQGMMTKREELLKMINEVENNSTQANVASS